MNGKKKRVLGGGKGDKVTPRELPPMATPNKPQVYGEGLKSHRFKELPVPKRKSIPQGGLHRISPREMEIRQGLRKGLKKRKK